MSEHIPDELQKQAQEGQGENQLAADQAAEDQQAAAEAATLLAPGSRDGDGSGMAGNEGLREASVSPAETEAVSAATYDVYLEETAEGATLALILDLPGCFANGATRQEALAALQHSTAAYHAWLRKHDDYAPDVRGPFIFTIRETFQIIREGEYEINSFFAPDAGTATDEDIEWALTLLKWQREDLIGRLGAGSEEELDWKPMDAPDTLSIRQALDHLAQAEVWYMGRLDEKPPQILVANIPGPTIDRLQRVRQAAIMRIKSYPKELRGKIFTHQGEQWTLRKSLRRTVWHERDHLNQIDEILAAYQAAHG